MAKEKIGRNVEAQINMDARGGYELYITQTNDDEMVKLDNAEIQRLVRFLRDNNQIETEWS